MPRQGTNQTYLLSSPQPPEFPHAAAKASARGNSGQAPKPLRVLLPASCVFGYPENHLAFALRHHNGKPRAKGEKPAQLGFSSKMG